MKKALFTIALAAFAFAANAQFVVSGQLGVNHNGGKYWQDKLGSTSDEQTDRANATTTITFAPKVGYKLNDNMQAGLGLTIGYNYNRRYMPLGTATALDPNADLNDNSDQYTSTKNMTFGLAPYFRYYAFEMGKFNFFCEATFNFGITTAGSTYNSVTDKTTDNLVHGLNLGFNIVPGLNYAINDNMSIDLYINLASFGWNMNKTITDEDADNLTPHSTSSTHDWGFNVNANAQTLQQHLGNFSLGFNYAF